MECQLASELESFIVQFFAKMNIPGDLTSSDQPLYPEGAISSNSQTFKSHQLQRDLRLPRLDVKKFDRSDPTGWVTQMGHYISLHGITNDLAKLCYGFLHLDSEFLQWWQWHKRACQGYVAWT
jgi:hypothetical protein